MAAHVQGRAATTELVSTKGDAVFAPLAPDEAGAIWQGWWAAWGRGMRDALPVDIKAAGAWLRSGADRTPGGGAWQAARDAYDGAAQRDLYLRRCYPDFDSLVRDGRFFDLAIGLYGALAQVLPRKAGRRPAQGVSA